MIPRDYPQGPFQPHVYQDAGRVTFRQCAACGRPEAARVHNVVALEGVRQTLTGEYPRFKFTDEQRAAMAEGYVEDNDPEWEYRDMDAHVSAILTPLGIIQAKSAGWLAKCRCVGCKADTATSQRNGFCRTCWASGTAYHFYKEADGILCGADFVSRHPEVLAERRRSRNPAYEPAGIVRVAPGDLTTSV